MTGLASRHALKSTVGNPPSLEFAVCATASRRASYYIAQQQPGQAQKVENSPVDNALCRLMVLIFSKMRTLLACCSGPMANRNVQGRGFDVTPLWQLVTSKLARTNRHLKSCVVLVNCGAFKCRCIVSRCICKTKL